MHTYFVFRVFWCWISVWFSSFIQKNFFFTIFMWTWMLASSSSLSITRFRRLYCVIMWLLLWLSLSHSIGWSMKIFSMNNDVLFCCVCFWTETVRIGDWIRKGKERKRSILYTNVYVIFFFLKIKSKQNILMWPTKASDISVLIPYP